ncbi:MAG: immunoglobulin domain-containing protein [Verrucomicrobiota bacterium]
MALSQLAYGLQAQNPVPYVFTTIAGTAGVSGHADNAGAAASFNQPSGLAVDAQTNIYVADTGNHTIRKIDVNGNVTTLAGLAGSSGLQDGTGAGALFTSPQKVAVDSSGNIYVADTGNNTVRYVSPGGVVNTPLFNYLGGSPDYYTQGDCSQPESGAVAAFSSPAGITVDGLGNVYVANGGGYFYETGTPVEGGGCSFNTVYFVTTVRKILPDLNVSTVGYAQQAIVSGYIQPILSGIAIGSGGTPYSADLNGGGAILNVSTAGFGPFGVFAGSASATGSTDATGSSARFSGPQDVAADAAGNLYVADTVNNTVRMITPAGVVTTIGGLAGSIGSTDLAFSGTRFKTPQGIASDSLGNIYIADTGNNTIRKGVPMPIAIYAEPQSLVEGVGYTASFSVLVISSNAVPYGCQWYQNGVGLINATNATLTLTNLQVTNAGSYVVIATNLYGSATSYVATLSIVSYTFNTPISGSGISQPLGLAVDAAQNVYFADYSRHVIWKSSPGTGSSLLAFAGLWGSAGESDGIGDAALFDQPFGLVIDTGGNLYVADSANNLIRKITPAAVVTTIAGVPGGTGLRDGSGSTALFNRPTALAIDSHNSIYIADYNNGAVRKLTNGPSGWQVTTLATGFNQPDGVAADSSGKVYVADSQNEVIRTIATDGTVHLLAGTVGAAGSTDLTTGLARFNYPEGLVLDASGNLLVADAGNDTIRLITPGGLVGTIGGLPGNYNFANGTGSNALFRNAGALAFDSYGNLYVSDFNNSAIRAGTVPIAPGTAPSILGGPQSQSVVATYGPVSFGVQATGSPTLGYQWSSNGTTVAGATTSTLSFTPAQSNNVGTYTMAVGVTVTNGVAPAASAAATLTVQPAYAINTVINGNGIAYPFGVAIDGSGNVFFSDSYHDVIWRFAPGSGSGLTVFAGLYNAAGNSDGVGQAALFNGPGGLVMDAGSNLYVADWYNEAIRMITPGSVVTTIAGVKGSSGFHDGPASIALFSGPVGLAIDSHTNLYVADYYNGAVRKLTNGPAGWQLTTLATGFSQPNGVAVDSSGNVYVADSAHHVIQMITPAGAVSVIGGVIGQSGSADGLWSDARFNYPEGVLVDGAGHVIVADSHNNTLRILTPGQAGTVVTVAGIAGNNNFLDGTGSGALFRTPVGLAFDSSGNLFVADYNNNAIREHGIPVASSGVAPTITSSPQNRTAVATYGPVSFGVTAMGSPTLGYQWSTNGTTVASATTSTLSFTPAQSNNVGTYAVAVGVTVTNGVSPAATAAATLTVQPAYAINTVIGGNGIANPLGVAIDGGGNVFFSDGNGSRNVIWKYSPGSGDALTVFAGLYNATGTNDGIGSGALFNGPYGLVIDAGSNLYVGDSGNHTIRMITPAAVVTTIAGVPGTAGNRDNPGNIALFDGPTGLAMDSHTNLYVADYYNGAIRKVTNGPAGWQVTTVAAGFYHCSGVAVDASSNVYVADSGHDVIQMITPGGAVSIIAGQLNRSGNVDGLWSDAQLNFPQGILVDPSGRLIVADGGNNSIRLLTLGQFGTLLTVAGSGSGNEDGTGSAALFRDPIGLTFDSAGDLFIADYNNGSIREHGLPVSFSVISGVAPTITAWPQNRTAVATYGPVTFGVTATGSPPPGYQWSTNGTTIASATTSALSFTPAQSNNVGTYSTTVGVTVANGVSPAATASATLTVQPAYAINTVIGGNGIANPLGVAVDGGGNVFFSDANTSRNVIWKYSPGSGGGLTVFAGLYNAAGTNDGIGSAALFYSPAGLVMDAGSNLYVCDSDNHTIRMITPAAVVTTIAGVPGTAGYRDNPGNTAFFNGPNNLAIDSHTNLYVADYYNGAIRKVTNGPAGWQVTTVAAGFYHCCAVAVDASGNVYVADSGHHVIQMITPGGAASIIAGQFNRSGNVDGLWSDAQLNSPEGILVDSTGHVLVADTYNNSLRILTPGQFGTLLTVAGSGSGSQDGTGSAALFRFPIGLAFDSSGDLFVADYNNSAIREHGIPIASSGIAPTITSLPQNRTAVATYGPVSFGVTATGSPTLGYQWSTNGTTLASATTSTLSFTPAQSNNVGTYSTAVGVIVTNGVAPAATAAATLTVQPAYAINTVIIGNNIANPAGMAVDGGGNVFFSDANTSRNVIWKYSPGSGGALTIFAGLYNAAGTNDGIGSGALFNSPYGLVMDAGSNLYVGDSDNHTIRMITPAAVVTTIAGVPGTAGYRDNPGNIALFDGPTGLAMDSHTNLYVTDYYNGAIRKVTNGPAGWQVTTVAAGFNRCCGVAVDASGNVYVADSGHHVIQLISPAGAVSIIAGQFNRPGNVDGLWSDAQLNFPEGILVDATGHILVADTDNNSLRILTPGPFGTLLTVAGSSYSYADGTGSAALFRNPVALTFDALGNLFIADYNNGAIREHGLSIASSGVAPTITSLPQNRTVVATYGPVSFAVGAAGSPTLGYQWSTNGTTIASATTSTLSFTPAQSNNVGTYSTAVGVIVTNGVAPAATAAATLTVQPAYAINTVIIGNNIYNPAGVAVDSTGNVFFSDAGRDVIWKYSPGSGGGLTIFAGLYNAAGTNDGIGSAALFYGPYGLVMDAGSNLYVADSGNDTIRMITPAGVVSTIAGVPGAAGFQNNPGNTALFNDPTGLAMDSHTNLYVADYYNGAIRKVTNGPAGWQVTTVAAGFYRCVGVAVDASGNVYVADSGHDVIQMITPGGAVSVIAGQLNHAGNVDGLWSDAQLNFPEGILVDATGHILVADTGNNSLRILTPGQFGTLLTVAGSSYNYADGTGSAALFRDPVGLAFDSSGDLFIADYNSGAIREHGLPIASSGIAPTITSLPQNRTVVATYGPVSFAVGAAGSPTLGYQWSTNGTTIASATTSTLSFTPAQSNNVGTYSTAIGVTVTNGVAPAATAAATLTVQPAYAINTVIIGNNIYNPLGVAVDPTGNVFFSDGARHVIWEFATGSGGGLTVFAGLFNAAGTNDGIGSAALFYGPYGLVMDAGTNLYVADSGNHTIRMITPAGVVSTIAGVPGTAGYQDNPGNTALFNDPNGLAIDGHTNLYVADYYNGAIRKVTNGPAGWQVTTVAAGFYHCSGVAVDASGYVYVADSGHDVLQMITPGGAVSIIAGQLNRSGNVDGLWSDAQLNYPQGIAVDATGHILVADTYNNSLRVLTPGQFGTLLTVAGSSYNYADGTGSAALFRYPVGLTFDSLGNLFIADYNSSAIRERMIAVAPSGISPSIVAEPQSRTFVATYGPAVFSVTASGSPTLTYQWYTNGAPITGAVSSSYSIATVQLTNAGTYSVTVSSTGAPGSATSSGATLTVLPPYAITTVASGYNNPYGIAVDGSANVYFADYGRDIIVKIPGGSGNGVSVAGVANSAGTNDGTGSNAKFYNPFGVAVDVSGNVYISDFGNNTIRLMTPGAAVSTIAGTPKATGRFDGAGSVALFNAPAGLAMDSHTNLYVADYNNGAVRKVTNGPSGWQVTTLATGFSQPSGVAVDASSNVYVADSAHHVIQMITPAGAVSIIAGQAGRAGNVDGLWSDAQLNYPEAVLMDPSGNLIVADTRNNTLRILTPGPASTLLTVAGSVYNYQDGSGSGAWFRYPVGLAFDPSGDLYISDNNSGAIRERLLPIVGGTPSITTQPLSQDVAESNNFTLTVAATGTPAPSYQWNKNGALIPGQTTSAFTVVNAVRTNSGTYYVVVANTAGSVPSDAAVVHVLVPPILLSPVVLPNHSGLKLIFQDSDGGIPADLSKLTLQWRTNLPTKSDNTWQNITAGFSISGSDIIVTDPAATNLTRFYRLIEY